VHHHNRYLRAGMRTLRHEDSAFDAPRDAPVVVPPTDGLAGKGQAPRPDKA
jgi:hypothetical protein